MTTRLPVNFMFHLICKNDVEENMLEMRLRMEM